MNAAFYDLLKYAKTGIASSDMTAYDKMRAVEMASGGAVKTLTGVPPLTFKANGKPLISWSMSGNGQQTGTPTPDNPIMPEFVGVRTGNLWNYTIEQGGWLAAAGSIPTKTLPDNPTYQIRCRVADIIPIPSRTMSIACRSGIKINFVWINANGVSLGGSGYQQDSSTVTAPDNAVSLTFILAKVDDSICSPNDFKNIMLTSGYKIPITCAGQTQNVYLGEVQTTRKIKKLVLTGGEDWNYVPINTLNRFRTSLLSNAAITDIASTHFKYEFANAYGNAFVNSSLFEITFCYNLSTVEDWKSYLAAQYAAGTPVTVWYVPAESETAIVNEPLAKIGTYADTLDSADAGITIPTAKGENTLTVDTDLKPSSMTITYRG